MCKANRIFLTLTWAGFAVRSAAAPGTECSPCHSAIVASYSLTGMARSFRKIGAVPRVEDFTNRNQLRHSESKSSFTMTLRDGRFLMRRAGAGADPAEKEIHYVLGSGRQARSYVHRTAQGRLLAMPVTWYREGGGHWGMAPGYDRPDHPHFRRKIGFDCMFCHNDYPRAGADPDDPVYLGELPEGIGCRRCHGDTARHLVEPRRETILNPRRLTPERQNDVCNQCHLETTSSPLPAYLRRFGRGFFSYDPREPMSDYLLHFDHEPGSGFESKFEVVSAGYRMRKSACFIKSGGTLTCMTCHDPHKPAKANDAACLSCHEAGHGKGAECSSCHMAKRRPEDAPMTTISDHWIARNPAAVGSQSPPGPYHGSAAAYGPEDRLHTLVANAAKQADALRVAVESEKAPPREALIALAAALHRRGDSAAALRFAAQALALVPEDPAALRPYALIRFPSVEAARESVRMVPGDPVLLTILGEALRLAGRTGEAGEVFARAIDADPDVPDGYINLGVLHANRGERVEAIRRFRQALAIDPGNQAARSNWKLATQSAPSRR